MQLENELENELEEKEQETGLPLFDSAVNTRTLAKYIRQIEPRSTKYDNTGTRKKSSAHDHFKFLGETNTLTENFIKFQIVLTAEVEKVNSFFEQKEEVLLNDWEVFLNSLEAEKEEEKITLRRKSWISKYIDLHLLSKKIKNMFTLCHHKRESLDEFTETLIDFYRRTNVLINFSNLNFIAIEQLLTKYERILDKNTRQNLLANINKKTFISSENCYRLRREIESVYAQHHTDGNMKKARAFLRSEKIPNSSFFFAGTCASFVLCLAFVNLFMVVFYNRHDLAYLEAFPVYRALGFPLLFLWAWSLLMYSWERTNVNYLFIMQFQPQDFTLLDSVKFATFFSTIWFISFFLYLGTVNRTLPDFLLTSLARFGFMESLFHIFISPFGRLQFSDFFLADFILSSIPILVDLGYTVCWVCLGGFIQNPNSIDYQNLPNITHLTPCIEVRNTFIVNILPFFPYWWRMAQTLNKVYNTRRMLPHFVNTLKYLCGLISIVALTSYRILQGVYWKSGIFYFMFFSKFIAATYSLIWDIKMDWGLFRKGSHVLFLRDEALLIARWKYYAIIIMDVVLRYMWVLELYFYTTILGDVFFPISEMIRRSIWAYFRVELESLVNWEQYRTVDFVPSHLHSRHLHYLNNFSPKSPSYRFDMDDLMSGLQENEMLLNTQNLVHRQDANKEDEEESEELRELKIDSGEEDQDELQERHSKSYARSTSHTPSPFPPKSTFPSIIPPTSALEALSSAEGGEKEQGEQESSPSLTGTSPTLQRDHPHVFRAPKTKTDQVVKGEYEGEYSQPTGYEGEYKGEYGADLTQPTTGEYEEYYSSQRDRAPKSNIQIKGEYEVSELPSETLKKIEPPRKSMRGEYEVSEVIESSHATPSRTSIKGEYEVSGTTSETIKQAEPSHRKYIKGEYEVSEPSNREVEAEKDIEPNDALPKESKEEKNRESKSERVNGQSNSLKEESKLKKIAKGITHKHEKSVSKGDTSQHERTPVKPFSSKASQKGEYFAHKSSILSKGDFSQPSKPTTKGEYELKDDEKKKLEYDRNELENKKADKEKTGKKQRDREIKAEPTNVGDKAKFPAENPQDMGRKKRLKKTLKIFALKKSSDPAGT